MYTSFDVLYAVITSIDENSDTSSLTGNTLWQYDGTKYKKGYTMLLLPIKNTVTEANCRSDCTLRPKSRPNFFVSANVVGLEIQQKMLLILYNIPKNTKNIFKFYDTTLFTICHR